MKSPERMPVPAWEDISLEEIKEMFQTGETERGLAMAKLRYRGIRSVPGEIDDAILQSRQISREAWLVERDLLLTEMVELEKLIETYSKQ